MSNTTNQPHIGIAGAGLAGRLLAWRLALSGCQVSLFDAKRRDDLTSASQTAAAMLSPLAELAASDEAVFELGQRSLALWPQYLAQLSTPVYFRTDGTLVVAHPQDGASLEHFSRLLHHKLPAACKAQVQQLNTTELAQLEPVLAGRFSGGLYLAGEGQLANDQLMDALAVELDRLGVQWFEAVAVDLCAQHAIVSGANEYVFDAVVDARGVGSQSLPTLRGVRGEVLRVQCQGVTLQRPVRLMHPRYQLYVAPRPNGEFVVGATELESEDAGPVTVRSLLELGSSLYSLHPAFGEARVLSMRAALRPALDDHRPTVEQRDGVWHINGLYRHGYLCAPALVKDLQGQLLHGD